MKYSFETKFPINSKVKVVKTGAFGTVCGYLVHEKDKFEILVQSNKSRELELDLAQAYEESEIVKIEV